MNTRGSDDGGCFEIDGVPDTAEIANIDSDKSLKG